MFDAKYKLLKHSVVHQDTSVFKISEDHPIKIIRSNGDSIFFELKHEEEKNKTEEATLIKVNRPKEKMYFLLSDGTDKIKFNDFDISPLVIPLKIRPAIASNPLQFNGDVSIGPYFGYQTGSKTYSFESQMVQTTLTLCLFSTPSLVKLDASNNSISDADPTNNLLGISAGGGILFDLNHIQFGLVSGFDWISGAASKTWNYQGKPWYAFTIAYNLINK
jgi:hypothetical protein